MELRQLRYFVRTAETLNFSEAARTLYVTQSTLSQQIRQLEQELGTDLFQRDSHNVALTESGEQLFPLAKTTLQDADSCFDRISDLKQLLTGVLNIGITYTFAPILAETVRTFVKQYPGVKLNITCKTMEELMEMLKRREVDFVLAFKPTTSYQEIESHHLFDNYLSVVLRKDHALADKKILTIEDIRRQPIAMPSRGTQARNAFDQCFPGVTESLDVRVDINDVHTLLDLVSNTGLITILSDATIYDEDFLKAIPIDATDYQMEGCVHTLKKVYRKRSAEEFIKILSSSEAVRERARNWLK